MNYSKLISLALLVFLSKTVIAGDPPQQATSEKPKNMWYKSSTWRNLIDMHIPDWNPEFLTEFSPEAYVQAMTDAKVDASIVYTGNCLGMCFWPTKVGHMHQGLKGRNINAETIKALHGKNLNVIVYYNIWNRWAYDTYPSWRMVKPNGRSTLEYSDNNLSRYGQCCMNSEGYRQFVKSQIKDLCESFTCDGLWIDMIGFNATVCCCGSCRDKYLAETGCEIPKVVDWNNPEWVRFVRSRERWFDDFTRMIQETAHAVNPKLSLAFQSASMLLGWGGAVSQSFLDRSDYLAGDFYGPPMQYSVICKYMNNLTRNRPMEFMTSRCYDLIYHTTTRSENELRMSALGAFAHNAAFVFIDAIDPVGTIDGNFYRLMGRVKEQVKPYERAVSPDAVMLSDVAFYRNHASAYNPGQNGDLLRNADTYFDVLSGLQRIGTTMARNHILFDIIGQPQLGNLSRYPAIVLTEQYVLSDDEIGAFRRYVAEGGNLIVTGESGMNDMNGNRLTDFALADVLGVRFKGQTKENSTYIAPTAAGQVHFVENSVKYPLSLAGRQFIVEADNGVQTLATITLPYSSSDEIYKFGSAISNPPASTTQHPSITLNTYGKGQAMYIASPLENEKLRPQRQTFASLVRRMCTPRLSTNAPEWLEIIAFRDAKNKRYQLTFNNISDNEQGLVARDVHVTLAMPEQVTSVREAASNKAVAYEQKDGKLTIAIDELCDFAMLLMEYQ